MSILITILIALLVAAFGIIYLKNAQVPSLGVSQGKLKPISKKPNNVSSQTEVALKKVDTLAFKASQEATLAALKQAVANYGGGHIEKETDDYLYVIFTTSLMKYRDDVEFWLDTDKKEVHFRSASRAGYSDMGLNRQRYEKIASLYQSV